MTPALMAALALLTLAVLLPLLLVLRRSGAVEGGRARELAVYRSQLAELELANRNGLIDGEELTAARTEIERCILRLADADADTAERPGSFMAGAALLCALVLAAVPLYLLLGRPDLPAAPAAAAAEGADAARADPEMALALDRLAADLAADPDRPERQALLARSALALGRPRLAVGAFEQALAARPEDAELHAGLGEALLALADGQMTPAVRLAFARALAIDAGHPAARFYSGLARLQDGAPDEAAAIWRALLADAPEDAPWRAGVAAQLARLEAPRPARTPPPLDAATLEAAAAMDRQEQAAMIGAMVDRLAGRLADTPEDFRGWLELARMRAILGDEDGAQEALEKARLHAPPAVREAIDRQASSPQD